MLVEIHDNKSLYFFVSALHDLVSLPWYAFSLSACLRPRPSLKLDVSYPSYDRKKKITPQRQAKPFSCCERLEALGCRRVKKENRTDWYFQDTGQQEPAPLTCAFPDTCYSYCSALRLERHTRQKRGQ